MKLRLRPFLTAPLLGLAIALMTLIGPVSVAAAAGITFGGEYGLTLGSNCVFGDAHANTTLALTWKRADGFVKARPSVQVNEFGNWTYCSNVSFVTLETGDILKANDGVTRRTFVVPLVTLIVDRVADNFRGRAPAGTQVELSYHAGIFADYYASVDVTVNAEGKWKYNHDLIGGIDAYLYWRSAKGDVVSTYGNTAQVVITVGRSAFYGSISPGQKASVALRDSSEALKGVGAGVGGEYGGFSASFEDGTSHAVRVQTGDHVLAHKMASDLDWIVPEIEATANVESDSVSGACRDAGNSSDTIIVRVMRTGHTRGFSFANPDSNGAFEIDFSQPPAFFYDPANIKHGDNIVVECMLDTGDWVRQSFPVE